MAYPTYSAFEIFLRVKMINIVMREDERMFSSIHHDVLLAHQQSNVVHKYLCHCNSVYVGQKSQ